MSTKRPTKKLDAPVVKVKPSPYGGKAKDAEVAISQGDRPGRGVRINGRP